MIFWSRSSSSFHDFFLFAQFRMNHCALGNRNNPTQLRRITTGRSNNPYIILGVPPSASFRTVQKAFAKLAFEHHPDTTSYAKSSATSISEDFIRIRHAFERIRDEKQTRKSRSASRTEEDEDQGHHACDPTKYSWTETDFLDFFHKQTGIRLSSDQRRELVHLHRSRIQGGYYGGHSWDLARRLVAEQDAFLRNMQGGGDPPRTRSGAGRHSWKASFHSGPSEPETSGANNFRRKRRR